MPHTVIIPNGHMDPAFWNTYTNTQTTATATSHVISMCVCIYSQYLLHVCATVVFSIVGFWQRDHATATQHFVSENGHVTHVHH